MSKLESKNRQKQVIDHNYANNIFFVSLSTIQSLLLKAQNRHDAYRHKLFTNYDKVDYSSKSFAQLQSQLQTHLTILKASQNGYKKEYKEEWNAPSNFNIQDATQFATKAYNFFKQRNDVVTSKLIYDFIQLIHGQATSLFIDSVQIKENYSEYQKVQHRNNLYLHCQKAQQLMEQQKKDIQKRNIKDKGQLKANLNPNYGKKILKRYVNMNKEEYHKYYKGNKNFELNYIGEQLYNTKEQALNKTGLPGKRNNQCTLELQIIEDTVVQLRLIR